MRISASAMKMKMLHDGMRVHCTISGHTLDGRMRLYAGNWYICQNEMDGREIPERSRYGYRYSWCIGTSGSVKNRLLEEDVHDAVFEIPLCPKGKHQCG